MAEPVNKLCQTRENRFLGLFQFVLIAKYSLFAHGKKNRKAREIPAKSFPKLKKQTQTQLYKQNLQYRVFIIKISSHAKDNQNFNAISPL